MPFNKSVKSVVLICHNDFSVKSIVEVLLSEGVKVVLLSNSFAAIDVASQHLTLSVYISNPTSIHTLDRILTKHQPDSIFFDMYNESYLDKVEESGILAKHNLNVLHMARFAQHSVVESGYQRFMLLFVRDKLGKLVFSSCVYDGDMLVVPAVSLTSFQLDELKLTALQTLQTVDKYSLPGVYKVRVCCNAHRASDFGEDLDCRVVSVCKKLNQYTALLDENAKLSAFASGFDLTKKIVQISLGYTVDEVMPNPNFYTSKLVYKAKTPQGVLNEAEDLYQNLIRDIDPKFVCDNTPIGDGNLNLEKLVGLGLYPKLVKNFSSSLDCADESSAVDLVEVAGVKRIEVLGEEVSIQRFGISNDTVGANASNGQGVGCIEDCDNSKCCELESSVVAPQSLKYPIDKHFDLYGDVDGVESLPYKILVRSYAAGKHVVALARDFDSCLAEVEVDTSSETEFENNLRQLFNISNLQIKPTELKFAKMHGAGNDYIYIDSLRKPMDMLNIHWLAQHLSQRHFCIGSDGLVIIGKSGIADAKMTMFNSDSSRGAMCGNAIRCVAKYLYDNRIVTCKDVTVETDSGTKSIQLTTLNDKAVQATVNMGKAKLVESRQIFVGGDQVQVTFVDVGNPHCVVFVEGDLDKLDVAKQGEMYQSCIDFGETKPNVEFVKVVSDSALQMRVWERGSGETLACGTGACASVLACVHLGICSKFKQVKVSLKGGCLSVAVQDDGIFMTGDCHLAYVGSVLI